MKDLTCLDDQRRRVVREKGFNGLDYVEISEDQLTLKVVFLDKPPEGLTIDHFVISGGRRIQDISITDIEYCRSEDPELDDCVLLTVDKRGDFSTYTLCLINGEDEWMLDPRYLCVTFSFKANCASDLDCAETAVCPPPVYDEPEINYLAKDYASFRQLILDRLALLMPDWTERHVPDIGITLVELLAYAGDHLSYYQDAVATEAYLHTARQRISVRRHARLVDYHMHEGCNARAWLHLHTDVDLEKRIDPKDIYFITGLNQALQQTGYVLGPEDLRDIPRAAYEQFEPVTEKLLSLYEAHNKITIYTWEGQECCLLIGTMQATLLDCALVEVEEDDDPPEIEEDSKEPEAVQQTAVSKAIVPDTSTRILHLRKGDYLLFEEIIGPETGSQADADPNHRHVVRLTTVTENVDPVTGALLLEVEWAEEDALPFPLCLSAIGNPPDCTLLENVSIARGNMVLVDHGERLPEEDLGGVTIKEERQACDGIGLPSEMHYIVNPFRPLLKQGPLTFSQPFEPDSAASLLLVQDPRQALPQVNLRALPPSPEPWEPQPDLLGSGPAHRHFVVEMDERRRAHLRFGDNELGFMPAPGMAFFATYRVGNGTSGNVGARAISHLVFRGNSIHDAGLKPTNPLPAVGGTEAEPLSHVKQFAPYAFSTELKRAITAQDYADVVMAAFGANVQRAAATLRWTGSWTEVLVAVDQRGQYEADPDLLAEIAAYLETMRRIGHDVQVASACYVPLDILLTICVQEGYLRGHVKASLLSEFSNRRLDNGRYGYFHPDNLTFGQGIRLSHLIAQAQAIEGVESVVVTATHTRLERQFEGPNGEVENGYLPLGPLEIARVDNDPSFPENGQITFALRGGR